MSRGTRRRALGLVLGVAACWAGASPAAAQQLTVGLRAGGAVGNYTATDAGLDIVPRPSFAVVADWRLTESLSAYLGFNRSAFGCEEALCSTGDAVTLTSQGVTVGGRYSLGFLWARAGAAFQALTVDSDVDTETSDFGVGVDLAAGVAIPVAPRIVIRPGVSYLRHGAATDFGDGHVALLAAGIGVAMRF